MSLSSLPPTKLTDDVLVTVSKQHLYNDARTVFRDVANKNLDWPEAIWDAWIQFEQVFGSVEELEDCLDRVERARERVNMKRAKNMEKAAYEAMQVTMEQQAANVPVSEIPVPHVTSQAQVAQDVPMDIGATQQRSVSGGKRKAEDELVPEETKKQHTGAFIQLSLSTAAHVRAEPSPAPLKRQVSAHLCAGIAKLMATLYQRPRELHRLRGGLTSRYHRG